MHSIVGLYPGVMPAIHRIPPDHLMPHKGESGPPPNGRPHSYTAISTPRSPSRESVGAVPCPLRPPAQFDRQVVGLVCWKAIKRNAPNKY